MAPDACTRSSTGLEYDGRHAAAIRVTSHDTIGDARDGPLARQRQMRRAGARR